MDKHSKVKNRRKIISPVFHLQTKAEDEKHFSKEVVKSVRKTGVLNLSGKHLASVPEKLFSIYDFTDENVVNLDFNRPDRDDELWWNLKPLTNLDLSSNVLTEVPGRIATFQDLTIINLQDNSLTCLPAEITTLTKLTRLILNHNKINTLPNDIDKLIDLRVLRISHNLLEELPDSLVDLVMLETLDLSYNSIEKLPSGIGFLVRLTDLNVSNNKIKTLPPDIVNLRSLIRLDINYNNIKHLPESLGELRKLQLLYAQHNDIEEVPDFTGCESLQEIYLGNNFIKEIPPELHENLLQLKILELRDNQIEILPKEIAKMVHLTQLDLSNNELTEITPFLGLLPHLHSLKLEGNKLKQIRGDIIHTGTQRILQFLREKLKEEDLTETDSVVLVPSDACVFPDRYKMRNGNILNLTMKNLATIPDEVFSEAEEAKVSVVDLCKNKLTTVPSGLQKLSNYLTELNLSANQLKEIPDFVGCFTKLKFLDLSNNALNDLPDISLSNLRELVLFNNRFSKIPQCVFGMTGLEILMLNDNKLDEIDVVGLQKLTRLSTLDLTNNNINFVPPELGNMTHIRCLEIKGNPFKQPRYAILEQGTESVLAYLRDKIPR
ncbi:leucine-rich repeat-containing protein 40-like [Sitophilus oryzae]|uniref:Leucine-rich repeat-containing protein 40-like n=1 Tax=Sitophilus oryzae TaxID=7048 RepID=A0A6J2XGT0_SITOR|nr:leucine-rich repeat-containing protein 40-like [Sitophilus oryzae]